MIPVEKLNFWLKNNLNVLFEGKHGIGKTTIVVDTFKRHGLKFAYLSAATLDPWVDFIGIPKEVSDDQGNRYLELIRPKDFANDNYDIIFIDELNRAPAKLRNAILELIQFKSINGKKYNRLKAVWGAINPDTQDNIYDVERLDPAQKDRFHIHYKVDYAPDTNYFTGKFGDETAMAAIQWWNGLTDEAKEEVSPRRLDYALEIHRLGGDLRDCLHQSSNVGKLVTSLESGVPLDKLKRMHANRDAVGCELFLANENNYNDALKWILEDKDRTVQLVPLMSSERICNLMSTKHDVAKVVAAEYFNNQAIQVACDSLRNLNKDSSLTQIIQNAIPALTSPKTGTNPHDIADEAGWSGRPFNKAIEDKLNLYYNEKVVEAGDDKIIAALDEIYSYLGTGMPEMIALYSILNIWIMAVSLKNTMPVKKTFGMINFLTKQHNIDIRKETDFKNIINFIISVLKSEEYIWVPTTTTAV